MYPNDHLFVTNANSNDEIWCDFGKNFVPKQAGLLGPTHTGPEWSNFVHKLFGLSKSP